MQNTNHLQTTAKKKQADMSEEQTQDGHKQDESQRQSCKQRQEKAMSMDTYCNLPWHVQTSATLLLF